jgi:hypothetical protein
MLMRIIFTILLLAVSFTAISQAPDHSGARDSSYRFKTVCLPVKSVTEVLYVIDGIVSDESVLRRLNPSLIDSIFILKDSATRIFSCRPSRPVILIYTRRSNNLRITIRDKEGQFPLPGATVTFISSDRRDTLMYVADSLGKVGLKELNKRKSYTVRVSSSGYLTFTGLLSDQVAGEIRLERDFKTGPAVVISSFHSRVCCRGCGGGHQLGGQDCGLQLALIRDGKSTDSLVQPAVSGFRVYPNPGHRGQPINLRLFQGYFPEGSIHVLSLDGKKLFSVPVNAAKKQGQVQIPTEQRWAAGVYIFQLVYANGRVGASEKVIIQ